MGGNKSSSEELKQKARRRLLKLGAYSIPAMVTVLATEEAYAAARRSNPQFPKQASGVT